MFARARRLLRSSKPARRGLLLQELEERLLFTAVPMLTDMDADGGGVDLGPDVDDYQSEPSAEPSEASDEPRQYQSDGDAAALRQELVIIDASVDDPDQLLQGLQSDSSVHLAVLRLGPGDAIAQIDDFLAGQSGLDAIHLVSHGSAGSIHLGDTVINDHTIDGLAGSVARWGGALATQGDLLIYGCDLAADDVGRDLIESLAALTGADVAASDDATGHQDLGGDWELEYQRGAIETNVFASAAAQSSWRHILAADPEVVIAAPGTVPIGESFNVNVTFSNDGSIGYGPYIDVLVPFLGEDGVYDNDTTGDGSVYDLNDNTDGDGNPGSDGKADGLPDGVTINSVSLLGQAVSFEVLTFGEESYDDNGTPNDFSDDRGTVLHPYAVNPDGTPVEMTGRAGEQLLVVQLPFGSFTARPARRDDFHRRDVVRRCRRGGAVDVCRRRGLSVRLR